MQRERLLKQKRNMDRGGIFEDEFLTPEEVAEGLKVKATTVREWLKAGDLRAAKLGRVWRIRVSDLDEFVEQNIYRVTVDKRKDDEKGG